MNMHVDPALAEGARLFALRREIETALQRMLDLLDAIDAPTEELEEEPDRELLCDPGEHLYDPPEDPDRELDLGEGDAELGWANEGRQTRLHADRTGLDREHSFGATGTLAGSDHLSGWRLPLSSANDECEPENEHGGSRGEADDDGEPTLGATEAFSHRAAWQVPAGTWGSHPTGEDEPSLGWTVSGHLGGGSDREHDPAECGIADLDGLAEQGFGWNGVL